MKKLSSPNWTLKTWIILVIAVSFDISGSIAWYWFKPVPSFLSYLSKANIIIWGFLLGFFDSRGFFIKAAILVILLTLVNSFTHWTAGQYGLATDFITPSAVLVLSVLTAFIFIPLILIGGGLAWITKLLIK